MTSKKTHTQALSVSCTSKKKVLHINNQTTGKNQEKLLYEFWGLKKKQVFFAVTRTGNSNQTVSVNVANVRLFGFACFVFVLCGHVVFMLT